MIGKAGAAISVAVASIAGLVALWELAGFTAVIAYRRGQIADHHCLAQLPVPVALFKVGVVALALTVCAAVLAVLAKKGQPRKTILCLSAVYAVVMAPLLVASIALYTEDAQPEPLAHTACISGDDGSA
ncbi:hypothetical protein A5742_14110 [Mycolicibacterium fortuitum]|uniref:Uncharacterized protein n=1 Tax=Mycolicibacterium fortuitum TaxID=1766 RepID=A0ABD6QDH5_MYCFO|nr:hypothetical protein [Mycolicibacterium fortuitum]OMC34252.1 hypothetical protein A5742_14110 [Mycolicibacterium fortuitum]